MHSGIFIFNNYRQALDRIKNEQPKLDGLCEMLQVTYEDLDSDLIEEREFVSAAVSTVEENDMGIQYIGMLVELNNLKYVVVLIIANEITYST